MPQSRHTESSILESYLLPPSQLPTILPYSAFLQLVPTQYRSHPHLKRLYRDLQFQRNIDVDTVRQNIEREVARSVVLKGQLARQVAGEGERANIRDTNAEQKQKKRKRASDKDDSNDNEMENQKDEFNNPTDVAIDTAYMNTTLHPAHISSDSPPSSNHPLTTATRKHHTSDSLLTALDSACSTLEAEIADLDSESSDLLAEMNEIVGSLSDLRYGRFARPVSGDHEGGEPSVEAEVLDALRGLQNKLEQALK